MSGIAITFPSSPVEGQSYLAQNGFTYIYDSQKNRWKRGGDFVRAPKVLSFAGVAVTTTGSGITTGPTGALIYNIPGVVLPNSEVGVDSYKAYRASDSYPNYTEVQVSISSAFSTIAYAATFTGTTHTIPGNTLSGDTTYYLRARQFVGSNAGAATTGAISSYSANPVRFITTSVYLDAPTIVSIAGSTRFPVYQIGFAGTTLPATVTYTGNGLGNLQRVEWRVTGPRNPDSTGDTALAEVGIGTFSSATLANALVLAMPFSGATGVGITNDVNGAIRTASGASSGTTKTITAVGGIGTASVGIATTTAHFYPSAAFFDGVNDYAEAASSSDFAFGTDDFTFEFWYYHISGADRGLFANNSGSSVGINFLVGASGPFRVYNGTAGNNLFDLTASPVTNTWQHLTLVRKSGLLSLFVNGVLQRTVDWTGVNAGNAATFSIGSAFGNARFAFGYIQDFKIYKGLAKYQENFTPPLPTYGTISYTTRTIGSVGVATTAFFESTGDIPTAEASSTAANALVLAMPMNRTFGFQDINVAIRGLTSGASAGTAKTVGLGTTSTANAPTHPRISLTESKWYDGAAYFDGEDYVTITNSSDVSFGTGDFTVEGWCYRTGNSNYAPLLEIGNHAPSTGILFMAADATASNVARIYSGGFFGTSNILPLNQWYHLAFVRSSGNLLIYVDGVLQSSTAFTNNLTDSTTLYISNTASYAYRYTGYFQDIKVYKGFAKYTANFTPPRPICGFTTDISTQTGFTTTSATGVALTSIVGLGSTSTLAFGADQTYVGITSITSSSGITTLPDPYAQNLVLALPLANITGAGNSFTNDRNTQIRTASITGAGVTAGTTKTITNNSGVSTVSISTVRTYNNVAYFSGSNYLSSDISSDFTFGTNDFTVEFWVYPISISGERAYFQTSDTPGGLKTTYTTGVYLDVATSGTVWRMNIANTSISSNVIAQTNTWQHIAITRRSSIVNFYVNGVLGATPTVVSGNLTATYIAVGGGYSSSYLANAYITDFKVYNGLAKYTTNFTPPPPMFGDYTRSSNKIVFTPGSDYALEARNTATGGIVTSTYSATRQWGTKPKGGIYDPFASNLVLAIPGGAVGGATSTFDVTGQIRYETPTATYVNAGIVTYSNSLGIGTYQNKTVTNTGPVSISSTITKYYSRSMQFNGSNYLTISEDLLIGTGAFTIEFWFNTNSSTRYAQFIGNEVSTNSGFTLLINDASSSSGDISIYNQGAIIHTINDSSYRNSVWTHLSFVRDFNGSRVYIDGILKSSNTGQSSTSFDTNRWVIGLNLQYAGRGWIGYINDLRIYKGLAKYTSNFTPPNQIFLT